MPCRWSWPVLAAATFASPALADGPGDSSPAHSFTLAECLALADRNFANLWAARARLAFTHAQLAETLWAPWWQWSASSVFALSPPVQGTVIYTQSNYTSLNPSNDLNKGLQPSFNLSLNGSIPLYTFGKIGAATAVAEANIRTSEWDMEKLRQQMHMDVRRAYFGIQLARDAKYVIDAALGQLDKAIASLKDKIDRGAAGVSEIDRLRLQAYREDVASRSLQAPKGEAYGLVALRFLTGEESSFDVRDQPLTRPDRPLVGIVQYLAAARILRPDVNIARATAESRRAAVDYSRAKLFPDLSLALASTFATNMNAPSQLNVFSNDSFNQFFYSAMLSTRISLDVLPQAARISQAESQLEEARSLVRQSIGTAAYEVEKAYADALEAGGREQAWDKAEHDTKQWMAIVSDQIDLGTAEEGALLEPLRAFANARIAHLYALMDYHVALSALALTSGWDEAAPSGDPP